MGTKNKNEIISKLKKKLPSLEIDQLGSDLYAYRVKERININNVILQRYIVHMVDEDGKEIGLQNTYSFIQRFTKGTAVVRIDKIVDVKEENGVIVPVIERKEGLIDTSGKELMPCIFDSIHSHLDGHTEISKGADTVTTKLIFIKNGEFNFEEEI